MYKKTCIELESYRTINICRHKIDYHPHEKKIKSLNRGQKHLPRYKKIQFSLWRGDGIFINWDYSAT